MRQITGHNKTENQKLVEVKSSVYIPYKSSLKIVLPSKTMVNCGQRCQADLPFEVCIE